MSPKVEVTVSLSVFTVSKITSCVYFHVLRTTSHKKISRRGRAGTAKKCTKKRAKHTKNRFNFLNLLLLDVVLVAVAVVVSNKATQFYRCVYIVGNPNVFIV